MAFFQTKHLWIKQLAEGVAVLMLDREQSEMNFLDPAMLDDLERALDAMARDGGFRLLVIRSGKAANFCAGPSPSLLASWTTEDYQAWAERGQQVCNKLAELAAPSACVIAGGCFDAGLELALACDHRVVVDKPATELGFAELEWGMIPCWGGTQRLPRLVGLENSLQLLLAGQRLDAHDAWQYGLADDMTDEDSDEPPAFLANPGKRDWTTFPRRNWRERWLESNRLGGWFLFRGAERIVRTRIPEDMPAQREMLQGLRIAFQNATVGPGLEFERHAMERVAGHPALHNLLHLLEHRETLRQPAIAAQGSRQFHTIGVNGAGTEGLSLLLHCLIKGHQVVLRVESKEALGEALGQVVQLLLAEVQRGAMSSATLKKLETAIRGTYTWTHFEKIDLLLDTSSGSIEEKQRFYQDAESHLPTGALVVPTSGLYRIEDLRVGLSQPERVVGLHVLEPWNRGSVAEIAAPLIGSHNVQRVRNWAIDLGKYCMPVPDRAGGLVMRIWMPALHEAGVLIKGGVPIERIDQAMRRFGMSYGPCEWMDRIGIDHVVDLLDAVRPNFAGRIAFETGFSLMREKGWLGNRSGSGFYRAGLRKKKANYEAARLWRTQSQGELTRPTPALSEADSFAWIQRRLVTLNVIEAIRCLDEEMIADADDLDCAMCLTGWASHRGGPIGYVRHIGIDAFRTQCEELAREYGTRFDFPEGCEKFS